MKVEYKRDLQNNYMILEAAPEADDDGYHLRMAEQNEIQGLLSFHSGKRDGKLYLHYEITSKQSIENLYARNSLNCQDILFLLNGISDTLEGLQKYLLSPEHLLFDPQFIFVSPDKSKVFLCYLPGKNECPITGLAEFILKRLNHEDLQAVALGYQFYQKALEDNFSLQQTIKEILLDGEKGLYEPQRRKTEQNLDLGHPDEKGIENRNKNSKEYAREYVKEYAKEGYWKEKSSEHGDSEGYGGDSKKQYRWQEEDDWDAETEYEVTHKVRKKKSRCKTAADWLFERVHPMVILSSLFLIIVVEIVFFLNWISLTEAGGIFFFIISVELLINKFWKSRKEKKHQKWWEEEPDEEYQKLQQEVYQETEIQEEASKEIEEMEETRYLIQDAAPEGLRLVCLNGQPGAANKREPYPDIVIGKTPLYVGKKTGGADIILDAPTVSRMHARLEMTKEKYYVKDLNSKNGTFVNGERLMPQEQCEIREGDRIAFAEVLYHAVCIEKGSAYFARNQ